jgi:hypothetical protein
VTLTERDSGAADEPEAPSSTSPTRVFLSYAHDDPAHEEAVRKLWIFLRSNGLDAYCDLPATADRQDWPTWMAQEIRAARFVLMIASPEYRRRSEVGTPPPDGRGVQWEAWLIRQDMYANREQALKKYLPIILPGQSAEGLPDWIGPQAATIYDLSGNGLEDLLRVLTGQPRDVPPPLGSLPVLPPRGDPGSVQIPGPRPTLDEVPVSPLTKSAPPLDPKLVAPLPRLFLHYFDPHFMDEVTRGRNAARIQTEAVRATRLAVLSSEIVYLPAASYIESQLCARIVDSYSSLFDLGQFVLVGGEANLVDFAISKLLQYVEGEARHTKYLGAIESDDTPPFQSRRRSATQDIAAGWRGQLDQMDLLVAGLPGIELNDLEHRWASVPEALQGKAFTPEYVVRELFEDAELLGAKSIVARRAGSLINAEYFKSFTRELEAGVVSELSYLHSPHTGTGVVDLPYRTVLRALEEWGIVDTVLRAVPDELLELRNDARVAAALTASLSR